MRNTGLLIYSINQAEEYYTALKRELIISYKKHYVPTKPERKAKRMNIKKHKQCPVYAHYAVMS